MKYNISLLKDYSRLCTVCLTYIVIFVTILAIYEKGIPTPWWLLGIPFVLICYQTIQNYCYNPFLYIVLHGIFWIPAALIPFTYSEYRYLFFTLLLFEGGHALQVWRTHVDKPYEGFPWYLYVSIGLIYAIASGHHLEDFSLLIYYLGLGLLLLHFIRLFIAGLNKLLSKTEQATTMPARKIMLTTSLILVFFLLLVVILALWIQYSNIDMGFVSFGQLLVKGIRFLIRLVAYISAIIHALFAKNTTAAETEAAAKGFEEALEELQEPSLLAQILDGIIMIAAIFIMVYLIYRMIVSLIKIFSKRYAQDSDVVIQLSKPKDITQLPKEKPSIIKQLLEFFQTDNASKVRRGYRLKIRSYNPAIYNPCDTPADIATRIEDTYTEDISELTEVYEKARYSTEEITFEDVQKGGLL